MEICGFYIFSILNGFNMKQKLLRIVIYIAGFVGLYSFLATRSFPLMNAILIEKLDKESKEFSKYGELYYYSCIPEFRVEFGNRYGKYAMSDKNPDITDADILTYGDSFFGLAFQKCIPELLADTLDKKVFSYVTMDQYRSNPFYLLTDKGYTYNSEPKPFIYETVERLLPYKFQKEFPTSFDLRYEDIDRQTLKTRIKRFLFKKNTEELYDILLRQSYFTSKIYSYISMIRFNLFGYISPMTSIYKTHPEHWLFYEMEYTHELGGYYYPYTDREIQTYAENIFKLKNNLKSHYNLDLVFLPIPTRYTIYHKLVNDDPYNNFLPRLYSELDKRGVNYVNLYSPFVNSPDILYHGTDTHWNPKGVDIALKLVLEKISFPGSLSAGSDLFSFSNVPN
jgi:hypothetical protein